MASSKEITPFGNVIGGLTIGQSSRGTVTHAKCPARLETSPEPLSTVPFARDPDYVDRDGILEEVERKLSHPGARVALVGLGGVGKSQLAIEYAHRVRVVSPSTWVIWLHASNTTRFEQSVRDTLDDLKVGGRSERHADIYALLRSWLREKNHGRWLLILDNADDASFLLSPPSGAGSNDCCLAYLPQCDHGAIMFISRSRSAALKVLESGNIVEVGPMDTREACTLLCQKLGSVDDLDDALELARALDCIPLAMSQAAAYIRQRAPRLSVRRYVEKLEKLDKLTTFLNREEVDPRRDREAENPVMRTWRVSFEDLRESRLTAADLLSLMSFFDRRAISEAALRGRSLPTFNDNKGLSIGDTSRVNGGTDTNVRARSYEQDLEDLDEDLLILRQHSFISFTDTSTHWEMHRLVQLATQNWLRSTGDYSRWSSQFVFNLHEAFPESPRYEDWSSCRDLFPHVVRAVEIESIPPQVRFLLAELLKRGASFALDAELSVRVAERLLVKSYALMVDTVGKVHQSTLGCKLRLAECYTREDRIHEAESLQKAVLDESEARNRLDGLSKTQGDDGKNDALGWRDPGRPGRSDFEVIALNARSALASTLFRQCRFLEAENLQLEVLEASQSILGEEHPHTLASMEKLASIYLSEGRYVEAEALQRTGLVAHERALGLAHPCTLDSMMSLASLLLAHDDEGRNDKEIEELAMRAVECSKRSLGETHPITLRAIDTLGVLRARQQRWPEACEVLADCMAKREMNLGTEHRDTLRTMHDLAVALRELGQVARAHDLLGYCLAIGTRALGAANSLTSKVRDCLHCWEVKDGKQEPPKETERLGNYAMHPQIRVRRDGVVWEEPESISAPILELSSDKESDYPSTYKGAVLHEYGDDELRHYHPLAVSPSHPAQPEAHEAQASITVTSFSAKSTERSAPAPDRPDLPGTKSIPGSPPTSASTHSGTKARSTLIYSTQPTSTSQAQSSRDCGHDVASVFSIDFDSGLTCEHEDMLIEHFSRPILEVLVSKTKEHRASFSEARPKVTELLKIFSRMRSCQARNISELRATKFVRALRYRISQVLVQEHCSVHSTPTSSVLSDFEREDDEAPVAMSNYREKIQDWDCDEGWIEPAGHFLDDVVSGQNDGDVRELPQPVADFKTHADFLLQSLEYEWLSRQLKVLLLQEADDGTMLQVRNTILGSLPDVLHLSQAGELRVQLSVPWSPTEFLRDQFPEVAELPPLGSIITLCGSPSKPYATTCGEYILQNWPSFGGQALSMAQECTRLTSEGENIGSTKSSHTTYDLSGTYLAVLEQAEALIWLAVACRSSSTGDIESWTPNLIKDERVTEQAIAFSLQCERTEIAFDRDSSCWRGMFRNPVLALGYPAPFRTHAEPGLEMSGSMLVTMTRAPWVTTFDRGLVLKGFSTMASALQKIGKSILWHFEARQDGGRIAYHNRNSATAPLSSHEAFFPGARHFVAWTEAAELLVGKWPCSENYSGFDSIGYGQGKSVAASLRVDKALGLSGGKFITAGLRISIGKKDTPIHFSTTDYQRRMDKALKWNVIFSDTDDKIHWLADGASAILHLCKAYLRPEREPRLGSSNLLRCIRQAEANQSNGPRWAYDTLLDVTLRTTCLHEVSSVEIKAKQTSKVASADQSLVESAHEVTTSSSTFQGLVEEYWQYLEQVHDRNNKIRQSRDTYIYFDELIKRSRLEGFDFLAIVDGDSWIEPKHIQLEDEAQTWLGLVKEMDTINLVGAGFGTLIQQKDANDLKQSQCCKTSAPFGHHDYLVAPMTRLKSVAERRRNHTQTSVQLTESFYWHHARLSFTSCRCGQRKSRTGCTSIVSKLHNSPAKIGRGEVGIPREHPIFSEYSQGAIIFGHEGNLLKKSPPRIQMPSLPAVSATGSGNQSQQSDISTPPTSLSSYPASNVEDDARVILDKRTTRLPRPVCRPRSATGAITQTIASASDASRAAHKGNQQQRSLGSSFRSLIPRIRLSTP